MKKNILTYTLVAVLAALSVGLNFLKIPLAIIKVANINKNKT